MQEPPPEEQMATNTLCAVVTDVEPTTETGGDQHALWSKVIMINAGTITEANEDQPALSPGAIVTDVGAVAEASCD